MSGKDASEADKAKKWQPLTNINPSPEDDNDPFSLGDDDDEKDAKTEDLRKDDTERLKESARNSVSAGTGSDSKLQETETSSTGRNAEAEKLLADKK